MEEDATTLEEIFDHLVAYNTTHPLANSVQLDDIPDTPATKEARLEAVQALRKFLQG